MCAMIQKTGVYAMICNVSPLHNWRTNMFS